MKKLVTIAAVAALSTLAACGKEEAPVANPSAEAGNGGATADNGVQDPRVSAETEIKPEAN